MIDAMRTALLLLASVAACAESYTVDQRSAAATDDGPGSAAAPFRTLRRGVRALKSGDALLLRDGLYRESATVAVDGVTIAAEPGAEPVLTGVDTVTGFARSADGRWSAPWPYRFLEWSRTAAHPDDRWHEVIGRVEQVLVDGYALQQVLEPDHVGRGTFCADTAAKRLWLRPAHDEPVDGGLVQVEAATRDALLTVTGADVRIRGLRFRYAANMAQHGMAVFAGARGTVEDCTFERANSVGAHFSAPDITVRRCLFADNGQLGFRAERAHGLRLDGCTVRGNNAKGFNRVWEAGGDKILMSRGVVIENSRFVGNRGFGLWFDVGNEDATVRNCLIRGNEDAGLFYEIGYGLHAHDNVVVGNGFHEWYGSWGAAGGITVSSSPGCTIERNLILGNREGFQFREFRRTTPRIDRDGEEPVWSHDETVRGNLLAWNTDAQCHGWFDLTDQRHWPKALQKPAPDLRTDAPETHHPFAAKDAGGQPIDLDLETLALRVDGNAYAVRPGQGLVDWGCGWRRWVRYGSLDDLRGQLGLEANGTRIDDLPFADALSGDYRLPAGHPALAAGCYPRGEVPDVRLGTR